MHFFSLCESAGSVLALTSREEATKGEKSFMRENVKYKKHQRRYSCIFIITSAPEFEYSVLPKNLFEKKNFRSSKQTYGFHLAQNAYLISYLIITYLI